MELVNRLIDYLQEKFPPNRVVVLLTPVFAAGAAFLAAWTAKHVPGLHLDKGQLTAVFVTGAALVVPVVYKWLDGWQKHEARYSLYYHAGMLDPGKPPSGSTAIPVYGKLSDVVQPAEIPPDVLENLLEARREAELRRQGIPPAP